MRGLALLQALGVDGSVPFERLPVPATKEPTFTLVGKQWVGGIIRGKGTGGGRAWDGADAMRCTAPDIGHSQAEAEKARIEDERRIRKLMAEQAGILDQAATDATAKAIGQMFGMTDASARKYGAGLVDRAIDRLNEILSMVSSQLSAANDNQENRSKIAA